MAKATPEINLVETLQLCEGCPMLPTIEAMQGNLLDRVPQNLRYKICALVSVRSRKIIDDSPACDSDERLCGKAAKIIAYYLTEPGIHK